MASTSRQGSEPQLVPVVDKACYVLGGNRHGNVNQDAALCRKLRVPKKVLTDMLEAADATAEPAPADSERDQEKPHGTAAPIDNGSEDTGTPATTKKGDGNSQNHHHKFHMPHLHLFRHHHKHDKTAASQPEEVAGGGGEPGTSSTSSQLSTASKSQKQSHDDTEVTIACIFDGHDVGGEIAAATAAETMKNMTIEELDLANILQQPQRGMDRLFKLLHDKISDTYASFPASISYVQGPDTIHFVKEPHPEFGWVLKSQSPIYSDCLLDYGCTATIALYYHNILIVANAGDSPAFLASCDTDEKLTMDIVTEEHSTANQREIHRLRQHDSTLHVSEGYFWSEKHELLRSQQMQITRSIGHRNMCHYGLSYEPFVSVHVLNPSSTLFFLATSDGVTEALIKEQILEMVAEAESAKKACKKLCKEAHDTGISLAGSCDDCSASLICFQ